MIEGNGERDRPRPGAESPLNCIVCNRYCLEIQFFIRRLAIFVRVKFNLEWSDILRAERERERERMENLFLVQRMTFECVEKLDYVGQYISGLLREDLIRKLRRASAELLLPAK